MILGIVGSARKNGITYQAVNKILCESGEEYEIISLQGKRINGCIACLGCAKDNRCKVKDDFQEIQEKMLKADVIVFGAANYFGMINSLSHAVLERTFAFRHNAEFSLEGKKAVIVTTSYNEEEGNRVEATIRRFFDYNKIKTIAAINVLGYSQCYSCGRGHQCLIGNVYKDHGRFLNSMDEATFPLEFCKQNESKEKCNEVIKIIKKEMEKNSPK